MNSQGKITPARDDLGSRLSQGDESALGAVLRDWGPAVSSLLQKNYSTLNEQDLDDILAIALFRLWKARERFDAARASLKTFFYHIADNAARDVFRHGWCKARQLEVSLTEWSGELAPRSEAVAGFHASAGRQTAGKAAEDVHTIMAKLPESYRQIVLADSQARDRVASVEFLSRQLDIPAGTVRVYRHRAMTTIRRELRKLYQE